MTLTQTPRENFQVIDKRYFPRWEVQSRVLFQLKDNPEVFEGHTTDLSCVGMCLDTHQPLNIHQKLKLVVYLSKETSVSLFGIAVWAKGEEFFHKIGIVFYNTPLETQDLILQFAFNLNKERFLNDVFKGLNR